MKKISEHLGEIIVTLASIALIISIVTVFSAPISSFFSNIVDKETTIAQGMLDSINTDVFYDGKEYAVSWEQGGLGTDGTEVSSNKRIRTEHIEVGKGILLSAVNEGYSFVVRVYGEDETFLGSVDCANLLNPSKDANWNVTPTDFDIDSVLFRYPDAKSIRIGLKLNTDETLVPGDENIVFFITHRYRAKISDDQESFLYAIDESGHFTSGKLKLPTSYSRTGTKTPLIVFIHGSGDYSSIQATKMTSVSDHLYNYLRDCGYAIFDCYGWGNLYPSVGSNTWGTPTNTACYIKGIEYVLKNYNLDKNNVFVACKSLGGIQALSLYNETAVNIKAVGMLSPETDSIAENFGYNIEQRQAFCADLGFTEDVNSVLTNVDTDGKTPIKDENYINYISENYDKLKDWNPYWVNLQMTKEEKLAFSITPSWEEFNNIGNSVRTSPTNRPLKIWAAPDDGGVYQRSNALVKSLQNGGANAELRTMPEGTGGHYSVDRAPNALQTTDVTTKLGVHYDSVPTAYYELREYFDSFLN